MPNKSLAAVGKAEAERATTALRLTDCTPKPEVHVGSGPSLQGFTPASTQAQLFLMSPSLWGMVGAWPGRGHGPQCQA